MSATAAARTHILRTHILHRAYRTPVGFERNGQTSIVHMGEKPALDVVEECGAGRPLQRRDVRRLSLDSLVALSD